MYKKYQDEPISDRPAYHDKLGYYVIVLITFLSLFAVSVAAYKTLSGAAASMVVAIVAGYSVWRATGQKGVSIVALLAALVLPIGNLMLSGEYWPGLLITIAVMVALALVMITMGNDIRIAEYDDVSHRQQELHR